MLVRHIISNFLGNGYVVILQFALVPLLLKYLGAEAYGLIGIYVTLLSALNIFDFGMSPALSRELARLSATQNSANLIRSTVTTLECFYLMIVLIMIAVFYLGAPLIAKYWLNHNSLNVDTVVTCLRLMGAQCALQLITNFYTSGLIGLQRMVRANGVLALNHTFRALGGLFVLIACAANVEVYFISQVILTLLGLLMTAYSLYVVLPADTNKFEPQDDYINRFKKRFSVDRFNACKAFAAGMTLTSVLTFFIMQTDKLILSKLVSLEAFGYYAVAVNIAVTIAGAASLVSKSVLPRMTQLVASHDDETLKKVYLQSNSLVAWLILPLSGVLIIASQPFLALYLGSELKAQAIAPIFSLLMFGYAVHSLMYVPYALSLAYGWTRYGIHLSVASILVMTPVTILATIQLGMQGAAISWGILSVGYLSLGLRYLHRHIHRELLIKFYKTIFIQLLILSLCFMFSLLNN